jgi:hypothetical protein
MFLNPTFGNLFCVPLQGNPSDGINRHFGYLRLFLPQDRNRCDILIFLEKISLYNGQVKKYEAMMHHFPAIEK